MPPIACGATWYDYQFAARCECELPAGHERLGEMHEARWGVKRDGSRVRLDNDAVLYGRSCGYSSALHADGEHPAERRAR